MAFENKDMSFHVIPLKKYPVFKDVNMEFVRPFKV